MGAQGYPRLQGQLWRAARVYQDASRSEDPGDLADLSPHLHGREWGPGGGGDEGHAGHEVQCDGGKPYGGHNHRLLWVRRAGPTQHDDAPGEALLCCWKYIIQHQIQVHRRQPDGVHWTQVAVRFQVNLILTHFCKSRGLPLPGRYTGKLLRFQDKTPETESLKDNDQDHNGNM